MRSEPWPRPSHDQPVESLQIEREALDRQCGSHQGRRCGLDESSPYKDQKQIIASNLRSPGLNRCIVQYVK